MNLTQKIAVGLTTATIILASTMTPVFADDGHNNQSSKKFGPFASSSTDGGSCGQPWANDTFNREFTVTSTKADKDDEKEEKGDKKHSPSPTPVPTPGTFHVKEEFDNGKFTTTGPVSPGACETTDTHHGAAVLPGIKGKFEGFLEGTVTGGTYNPNGCKANPSACASTAGFITTTFGPTAVFTTEKFDFQYKSSDSRLIFKAWRDKGDTTSETFTGDIATT